MRHFIALDIGGTDIKYSIIDEGVKIAFKSSCSTDVHAGIPNLVSKAEGVVYILLNKGHDISGIGISTAGIENPETGKIIHAGSTIPGYKGTNLKEVLEKTFQIPTIVDNDVNAAALGEAWVGAGKSISTFFCLTLGTGIGGAFVIQMSIRC